MIFILLFLGIILLFQPVVDRYIQNQKQLQLLTEWENRIESEHSAQNQSRTSTSPKVSALEKDVDKHEARSVSKKRDPKEVGEIVGTIAIDKIDVKEPILVGSTKETLNLGVGTVVENRYPGEEGNFVLAGHRSWTPGRQFRRLDELGEGDTITISDEEQTFTYRVTSSFLVLPNELSVLDQNDEGSEITLITCEPMYDPTHRLIVKAELIDG